MEDPGGLSVSIASHILTSSRLSTDGSSLESKTTCPTLVRRRRDVLILGHAVDEPEDIMSWKGMTPAKAMLAGATAGVTEHVCVFPVDTIKTRMQASLAAGQPEYRNVLQGIIDVAKTEGIPRLYRGVAATALGAIPSHAAHFATYEAARNVMGLSRDTHSPISNAVTGICATMAHDAIATPMDVVKQRLQMYNSKFGGVVSCIRDTFKNEGLRAFYASYPTTVALNVPYMAIHFATYEGMHTTLHNTPFDIGTPSDMFCGAIAGGVGGLATNPIDLVRTRVQTQIAPISQQRQSAIVIAGDILKHEGIKGFTKGASARAMMQMPSAAICWSVYEAMKRVLVTKTNE